MRISDWSSDVCSSDLAVAGLIINLISMRLLRSGKEQSLNLKGAYLEVWADMLGSIGVIGGAIAIRFTGLTWIDPVVAVGIGLRSEEHTSELQSLMRISYAVFCLKKKKIHKL